MTHATVMFVVYIACLPIQAFSVFVRLFSFFHPQLLFSAVPYDVLPHVFLSPSECVVPQVFSAPPVPLHLLAELLLLPPPPLPHAVIC